MKNLKKIRKNTMHTISKTSSAIVSTGNKVCKKLKGTANRKATIGGVVGGVSLGAAISIGTSIAYTNGVAAAAICGLMGLDD